DLHVLAGITDPASDGLFEGRSGNPDSGTRADFRDGLLLGSRADLYNRIEDDRARSRTMPVRDLSAFAEGGAPCELCSPRSRRSRGSWPPSWAPPRVTTAIWRAGATR